MKRISILTAAALLGLAASPAAAQMTRFTGAWTNVSPTGGGIAELQIGALAGGQVNVRTWGRCTPSNCDWGTVQGVAYGPNVGSSLPAAARAVSAQYAPSHARVLVVIRPQGTDQLQADLYTQFTDGSGRTAFTGTDTFRRRPAGPPAPSGPVAAEDCIGYNPRTLSIRNEGANGWLLTDGASRMQMLDSQADANRALALARRHTQHCFIGRNNSRPNRQQYISQYWKGSTGVNTVIAGEDCVSYGPGSAGVFNRGAIGWRLEDGSHAVMLFDTQADANRGIMVAQEAQGRLCFIGRSNSRPDRAAYIVEYWR
jgi:hypothetical protein